MTEEYKPSELMIKWEKALRDPNLVQVDGALCQMDADGNQSFCCLGVLEVVAGNTPKIPGGPDRSFEHPVNLEFRGATAWGETGLPDHRLIDVLFERETSPDYDYPSEGNVPLGVDDSGYHVDASELNDDYGWSFEEIADQIKLVYIDGSGNYRDYTISADRKRKNDKEDWY